MKQGIHPNYYEVAATCSCGEKYTIHTTVNKPLNLDVCGKCHPFYTGKQRIVDTGGRVEAFKNRFKGFTSKK
ncbi:50S ribosomal protein L31 [Psittacicella melopsittaci]|uniref:Large ribosomal subunit protein bL31 n=1 Tax=Psittacicella melopsittaci TaxID=2028576 RepID=A0A3A1Y6F4_9GAMM|nr:50S ribosomal protein L31 [Psittacicella melopsittaci]RIY31634.1 50S ribosomal protein L31 [Psittacicella melopsittaci]